MLPPKNFTDIAKPLPCGRPVEPALSRRPRRTKRASAEFLAATFRGSAPATPLSFRFPGFLRRRSSRQSTHRSRRPPNRPPQVESLSFRIRYLEKVLAEFRRAQDRRIHWALDETVRAFPRSQFASPQFPDSDARTASPRTALSRSSATSSYSTVRAPCSARFQFCARRATSPPPAPRTAPPEALCPSRLPDKVRRCHPKAKSSPENLRLLLSLVEIHSRFQRAASAILPTPASPAESLALLAIPFHEDFQ